MLPGQNIGLIATRQTQEKWDVLTTMDLCGHKSCAAYDINSLFPLYIYDEELSFDLRSKEAGIVKATNRRPNFTDTFLKILATTLQLPQKAYGLPSGLAPEDIFHYIYAVFYSPGYRTRYAEFLKIDFPHLPLTGSIELFKGLAKLGAELVALHLMESPKVKKPITKFVGPKDLIGATDPTVEKASYSDETVWLDKAKTIGFEGVSEELWNFHIGGYQVCEKWLKDRQAKGGKNPRPGRVLTKEDRDHYQGIIVALSETIRLMAEIDQVIDQYGGWPNAFKTKED